MSLNIEEVAQIFDDIEDDVMKKCIDECDKSIADILKTMKNPQVGPIKKKKVPRKSKSIKRDEWIKYVNSVKNELNSTAAVPISYKEAVSEASKRRKSEKNNFNINKIRKEKIEKNRRSVKFSDEIEETTSVVSLVDDPEDVVTSVKINTNIYSYIFIHNGIHIAMSHYVYKSYKSCLCAGLMDYLEKHSKDFNINMTNHPNFKIHFYMEKLSYNIKLFFNCWINKYFNIIYDDDFTELLEDFNISFLLSIPYNELEYIIQIFETISKNQKNTFPYLEINTQELVG
jgi:hypothetical protein